MTYSNGQEKTKSPGTLAENRKARHDYNIEDTIEAGIALQGTEIKSIRRGSANLKDSYAQVKRGEMYINNMLHTKKEIVLIMIHYDQESCYCIKRDYQTRRTYKRNWIFDYSFKIVFKTWTM